MFRSRVTRLPVSRGRAVYDKFAAKQLQLLAERSPLHCIAQGLRRIRRWQSAALSPQCHPAASGRDVALYMLESLTALVHPLMSRRVRGIRKRLSCEVSAFTGCPFPHEVIWPHAADLSSTTSAGDGVDLFRPRLWHEQLARAETNPASTRTRLVLSRQVTAAVPACELPQKICTITVEVT